MSESAQGRCWTGSDPEAPDRPEVEARNIVLFSDGTGNSSAKLFKTNVWRMYEAVDLGPPQAGERKQIAFYDNGVGTSSLKPIAALGAIFGIGLKRNVLDIYRYACRNYHPGPGQKPGDEPGDGGDHIYGFGFSRGAFTMRVAIDLIGKQGLVTSTSEAELDRKSEEAWRAYRHASLPRSKVSAAIVKGWRRLMGRGGDDGQAARNYHPAIQFLGVWDTVAAYGGPITEITRAIDNWIVRLSMVDYELGPDVRHARHALSIDDERDAFRPLPWDEIAEDELRDDPVRTARRPWLTPRAGGPRRCEQVWFTGMHADVGGGYPDESLSFVSFLWMMEEAKKAGLRPVPTIVDRFRALASSDGPLHDSRVGLGSYYRYQPRKIGAWLEPIDPSTLIQRDPDQKRGLLKVVKVHESVAARIASGTDRYAPITLPAEIRTVPPQAEGENAPLVTGADPAGASGASPSPAPGEVAGKPRPLITRALRQRLENPVLAAERVTAMEQVWRKVTQRRVLYFVTLGLTLLLFFMPIWIECLREVGPPLLASGHGLFATMVAALAGILPAFLTTLIATWAANPFYFLALLAGILLARAAGARLERSLRDRMRQAWDHACDTDAALPEPAADETAPKPGGPDPEPSPVEPGPGQRVMIWLKWSLLPGVIGLLFLAIAAWLLVVLVTRVSIAYQDRAEGFCPGSDAPVGELTQVVGQFHPARTCVGMGARVVAGRTYIVDVDVTALWQDGGYEADPAGLAASDIGLIGYVAAPLRRAAGANYLQPMVHIRPQGQRWSGPSIVPLHLVQQGSPRTRWRGRFVAPRSGELSLFANDVAPAFDLPVWSGKAGLQWFGTGNFYANNKGSACVTIVRTDQVPGSTAQLPLSARPEDTATCSSR